jgi:thiol-disulfide isomerase/thioredoxin
MLNKIFGFGSKKKKHQIVVFITNWCPHCQQMKHQVWTDQEVIKASKPYHGSKPMFLLLDKPENQYLISEFKIERYPTVIIMDEDRNVKKQGNNMPPEELVEFLKEL